VTTDLVQAFSKNLRRYTLFYQGA